MTWAAEWITQKGNITQDNRDHCGVAQRDNAALFVIADGSSQSAQSGELASVFVQSLADRFLSQPYLASAEQVAAFINEFLLGLNGRYTAARLSFLVLLDFSGSEVFTLHAGDCRLGRNFNEETVTWLNRPHTLANAIDDIDEAMLAQHENRHVLTRSLRAGRQCEIERGQYAVIENDCLLMATDGYWAELNGQQQREFWAYRYVPYSSYSDDISCLFLSRCKNEDISCHGNENFYLAEFNLGQAL